jgi:hypothetical protein
MTMVRASGFLRFREHEPVSLPSSLYLCTKDSQGHSTWIKYKDWTAPVTLKMPYYLDGIEGLPVSLHQEGDAFYVADSSPFDAYFRKKIDDPNTADSAMAFFSDALTYLHIYPQEWGQPQATDVSSGIVLELQHTQSVFYRCYVNVELVNIPTFLGSSTFTVGEIELLPVTETDSVPPGTLLESAEHWLYVSPLISGTDPFNLLLQNRLYYRIDSTSTSLEYPEIHAEQAISLEAGSLPVIPYKSLYDSFVAPYSLKITGNTITSLVPFSNQPTSLSYFSIGVQSLAADYRLGISSAPPAGSEIDIPVSNPYSANPPDMLTVRLGTRTSDGWNGYSYSDNEIIAADGEPAPDYIEINANIQWSVGYLTMRVFINSVAFIPSNDSTPINWNTANAPLYVGTVLYENTASNLLNQPIELTLTISPSGEEDDTGLLAWAGVLNPTVFQETIPLVPGNPAFNDDGSFSMPIVNIVNYALSLNFIPMTDLDDWDWDEAAPSRIVLRTNTTLRFISSESEQVQWLYAKDYDNGVEIDFDGIVPLSSTAGRVPMTLVLEPAGY